MNGSLFFYTWRPFDYEAETGGISDDGDLATRRLMDWCFKRGGTIPDDDAMIARLLRWEVSRWQNVRDEVLQYFRKAKGVLHHPHIDAEIRKAHRLQESRSLGAQLANAKRALTAQSANGHRPPSEQSAGANRAVRTREEEEQDQTRKDSDADASHVSSPLRFEETSPRAAKLDFWKRADSLVGDRGLVGRMAREFGRKKVNHALDAIERTKPDEPASYLVACCQDRLNGADDPDQPTWKFEPPKEPPPERLYPEEP